MSLTKPAAAAASEAPTGTRADERIAHRGPMRRWLISPEIGALIGAVVVWAFLWGNGETFGTAGTTLNWLDVAAPYGIMATAVALLMIGGEFDLSSGVQTGGAAMVIGLMARFFTGNGTNERFHVIIPVSEVFIADRPIHPIAVAKICFKIQVAPPIALPRPQQRPPSHNISPYPVESFDFGIGIFKVIDIKLFVVATNGIVPSLNGTTSPVFVG